MPLDATVGGANSNSYITNADADAFFANRLDGDDWILYAADQDLALMQATAEYEMYDAPYGERVTTTQALQYPRYNVPKRDTPGYITYYLPTEIPKPLKDAVCLRALTLLSPTTGASGTASSQTLKIGSSVSYETKSESSSSTSSAASSGGIYGEIGRLLRGLLKVSGVPMLRA